MTHIMKEIEEVINRHLGGRDRTFIAQNINAQSKPELTGRGYSYTVSGVWKFSEHSDPNGESQVDPRGEPMLGFKPAELPVAESDRLPGVL